MLAVKLELIALQCASGAGLVRGVTAVKTLPPGPAPHRPETGSPGETELTAAPHAVSWWLNTLAFLAFDSRAVLKEREPRVSHSIAAAGASSGGVPTDNPCLRDPARDGDSSSGLVHGTLLVQGHVHGKGAGEGSQFHPRALCGAEAMSEH